MALSTDEERAIRTPGELIDGTPVTWSGVNVVDYLRGAEVIEGRMTKRPALPDWRLTHLADAMITHEDSKGKVTIFLNAPLK